MLANYIHIASYDVPSCPSRPYASSHHDQANSPIHHHAAKFISLNLFDNPKSK